MKPKNKLEYPLGLRILYLRKKREQSQTETARKAQITSAYLSQIEGGKKVPTVDVLVALAYALDVHPAVFFIEDSVHVFDMKRMRSKYKKMSDLNDTLFRAIDDVVRFAKEIKFI